MHPPNTASLDRRIWALAWPLLLSNLTAPLLGLVDTAVVGHLDHARYLAAVALGANLFMALYFAFNFLRMGTTGLTAQAAGAGNDTRVVLLRALLLSFVVGSAMLALSPWLSEYGVALLGGGQEVQQLARDYVAVRILGAPAALANFALIGFAVGIHNTRVALKMTVLMHSVNAALDVAFVHGFGWGVEGLAAASACAEYVGVLAGLFWLRGAWQQPAAGAQSVWQPAAIMALLAVNRDIFLRSIALLGTFVFFTAQGARLGDDIVAANAILITFLLLLSNLLDGVANAAEALVGEAVGQRDSRHFVAVVRATAKWTLYCALVAGMALGLGGASLIALLTNLPNIVALATQYLPWLLLLPLTASASFWLDGVFVGATWSRAMRNAMLCSALCFVGVWWLTQAWLNHGLWLALNAFMLTRGLIMAAMLWRRMRDAQAV